MRSIQEIANQPKPSLADLMREYAEMFICVKQDTWTAQDLADRFAGVSIDTDSEGFTAATFTGTDEEAAAIVASHEFRDSAPRMNREGWIKDTDRVLNFWYSLDICQYSRALAADAKAVRQ